MLEKLRNWIGRAAAEVAEAEGHAPNVVSWFSAVRDRVAEAGSVLELQERLRQPATVEPSRYMVTVPSVDTVPTERLATDPGAPSRAEIVGALVDAIRPGLFDDTLPVPPPDRLASLWIEAFETSIGLPWTSLDQVVQSKLAVREEIREVLASDLTPAGGEAPQVFHYLLVPGDKEMGLKTAVLPEGGAPAPGVLTQLTEVRRLRLESVMALFHCYPASISPTEVSS